MFRILTTTTIVAVLLAGWFVNASGKAETIRLPRPARLTLPETIVALHRQLHRYLLWSIEGNLRPQFKSRVDWRCGRATSSYRRLSFPREG